MPTEVALEQYNGKKVIVTVADGDDASKELEGKVDGASDLGILLKVKGKAQTELIEASQILGIVLAPEKPKKISVKAIAPVELGKVRQHLADRHGIQVGELENLAEDDALKAHENIDHSKLAHKHEVPSEKPATADATEAREQAAE